ncbi:transposase [Fimbriiglobus ruber]|uniref:Mobile element protein n=1 Tax=Fimbriiglobus ruber TaxID=1908690 RepID=A0A225DL80_9BACT|nr:transposase [Fimbriiglobus ruber]OWK39348.1 Mobile element protein [Fimbriiglobus ruber]
MRISATKPLFAWDELDDSPSLQAIRDTLATIPGHALLTALRDRRHNGCNRYPVHVLWGVLLVAILRRHVTREACLAELRRNAGLRLVIGIEREDDVPHGWNLTRFLTFLGTEPYLGLVREACDVLVRALGAAVPDLGRHTAGDSTALSGKPDPHPTRVAAEVAQGLPQPSGGKKEYKDDDGVVTKIVEWFGYKLHLLVDVRHEVTLACRVTDTNAGDNERIAAPVDQAQANLPDDRIETLAYDQAADDIKVHESLDAAGIRPVIQIRHCWPKDGEQENVLGGRIPSTSSTMKPARCSATTRPTPVRRAMSYAGHERDRGTLKYRCPAIVEGFVCGSQEKCNAGNPYGMTVRVPKERDLRRFPPIPRATQQFERRYKGRTAVERVNARLKVFWGLDDGQVTGSGRFHAHVGAVMVIHLAVATQLAAAQRYEGSFGNMTLSPIAAAIREAMRTRAAIPAPAPG